MKTILIIMIMLVSSVHADDIQWSKGFTINCTNAVEREDGTALLPSEIGSIKYYAYPSGETTNNEHVFEFIGGCKAVQIDTKQLTTGVKDFYATTVDTDGRESTDLSATKVTHTIMKSRPKAPEPY